MKVPRKASKNAKQSWLSFQLYLCVNPGKKLQHGVRSEAMPFRSIAYPEPEVSQEVSAFIAKTYEAPNESSGNSKEINDVRPQGKALLNPHRKHSMGVVEGCPLKPTVVETVESLVYGVRIPFAWHRVPID
ncbi:hypothetical protein M413DRAFT_7846 [Hebeloma cylindrosporum]|uniref:Uncharacterized protein n=1 Tax=Hebeloma cylindrosporum TaxID=76867 RepID=A0A0C3CTX5_HEBCY|nr:hypothetical protein M413DRAFT_7846 [Hebeloma cylindrosporum h7]